MGFITQDKSLPPNRVLIADNNGEVNRQISLKQQKAA